MKKLNNRGFSLIELLVSIIILGIIITPLLRSFTTSASTAQKSLSIGNATVVGKNMAELTQAYPVSELVNNPTNCYFGASAIFKGFGASGEEATYNSEYIQMCFDSVLGGSETFKARVTLDATDASGYGVQNDELLSEYTEMDAVLAQSRDALGDPDQLLHDEFIAYVNNNYTDWIEENGYRVTRSIDLTVDKDTEHPSYKLQATVVYRYQFLFDYYLDETQPDGTIVSVMHNDGTWTGEREYTLFPQGYIYNEDGTTLMKYPNIYLMYYPFVTSTHPYEAPEVTPDPSASPSPEPSPEASPIPTAEPVTSITATVLPETINVYNRSALPFTLFLVKQAEPNATNAELVSIEGLYNTTIIQHQDTAASEGPAATIYSNVNESLVNLGSPFHNVRYRVYYGEYFSGSAAFEGELGTLVKKDSKNRMYKVTVEIFEKDKNYTDVPLYTFVSTKLQ